MNASIRQSSVRDVGQIRDDLKYGSAHWRQTALSELLLGSRDIKPLLPEIAGCLTDIEFQTRVLSVIVLEKAGADAVAFLIQAVHPLQPMQVRIAAASVLGRLKAADPAAMEALRKCLRQGDETLRGTCAFAMGQIGVSAVPMLASVLASDSEEEKIAAADALGWIGPDAGSVIGDLKATMHGASPLLALACQASLIKISRQAEEALPLLLNGLKSPDDDIRKASVERLGQLLALGEKAYSAVLPYLRDPSAPVRAAAALALVRIKPDAQAPVELLINLLRDDDEQVRANAGIALGTIGPAAMAGLEDLKAMAGERNDYTSGIAVAAIKRIEGGL